jgi:hypothetical protein
VIEASDGPADKAICGVWGEVEGRLQTSIPRLHSVFCKTSFEFRYSDFEFGLQSRRMSTMKVFPASVAAVVFAIGLSSAAFAQRGMGDAQGVAQQATKPKVVSLSGKVLKVETAPCEMTTGRSLLGTHFVMKTSDKKKVNIHLGPAGAVDFVTKNLSQGLEVEVTAFRTEKMKEGHYVARTLAFGSRTVELRDETLRPAWAGRGGPGWGRGRGAGYGRGRGAGWGRQGGRYGGGGWRWWSAQEGAD